MDKLQLEDLKFYNSLSSLSVNSNNKYAIFTVTQANIEKNNYSSDVWKYDVENTKINRLTHSGKVNKAIFISETSIIYPEISEVSNIERISLGEYFTIFYKQDILDEQNRKERLFELPLNKANAIAINDDLLLISSVRDASRPNFESLNKDEKEKELLKYKEESDYEVCDEVPFFIDSRGFVNKKRNSLYLYKISTNKLIEITDPLFETSGSAISHDGKYIVFSGVNYDRFFVRSHGIYLYDIENNEITELLEQGKYQIMGLDFYNDSIIIAAHPWNGYSPFPNHDLYLLNIKTKQMQLVYNHADEDFGAKTTSDIRMYGGTTFKVFDNKLFYLTTQDQTSYLNIWTESNKVKLTNDDVAVDFFSICNNFVLLAGLKNNNLQELYKLNIETKEAIQISNFNDNLNKNVITPIPHSFINSDGIRIDGFVIKPQDYDSSKKYPGILEIHGGPRASYSFVYHHEMQSLAANGYFVFYCNPRGSSGRGEDFADINGRRGTIDYKDVMEFTDYILSAYPQINSNKLAVMGGSYGGYLTNWIIGHTNRFKAAVSMRSIVDISSMYGANDYGIWSTIGTYGGTPWENNEKTYEQSPFKYAQNIETPTLILHSFEDHRCPVHGAMQLFSTLQVKGVPTRMCLFKNESHELSRSGAPKHRIRRLREILVWLDKYLKDH